MVLEQNLSCGAVFTLSCSFTAFISFRHSTSVRRWLECCILLLRIIVILRNVQFVCSIKFVTVLEISLKRIQFVFSGASKRKLWLNPLSHSSLDWVTRKPISVFRLYCWYRYDGTVRYKFVCSSGDSGITEIWTRGVGCRIQRLIEIKTRMWANAQRDGRPAEYRWRPLFNAAKFGWRPVLNAVQ